MVVDLCQYPQPFDVATLWDSHGPATLDRWTIDPAAGTVSQQTLNDRAQEFPRVDDRVISRPYRYGYSAMIGEVGQAITPLTGDFADQAFANGLLKHDLARGTAESHDFGRDATAGEAVFVAAGSALPKTTATSSPTCTTPSATPPTWSSSPRKTSRQSQSPASTCQPGSRWGSTAAG